METEKNFYNYLFNEYQPSEYEDLSDDTRFPDGVNYSHISRTRCFKSFERIMQHINEQKLQSPCRVLDLGFFPGTLIRILKHYGGDGIVCCGAGLKLEQAFQDFMSPYAESCDYTNFDPFYSKEEKLKPLKYESNSFDVIVATEVFEHLISPLEMIQEGARVLRKGGILIMTTPNVSHIGAVVKLILGRSNYERLSRSPMNLQKDEWRGHIRFYDKNELKELFQQSNLAMINHQYYIERGWDHVVRSFPQRMIYFIRNMVWTIPIYREGHFAVFEKK